MIYIATIMANTSFAARVGNGGGAWVCKNLNSPLQVRWAKLVDLFEATNEFKLNVPEHSGEKYETILDFIKLRIFKANKSFYTTIEPYFERVEANIVYIDADLEIINDSLYRIKPGFQSCENGEISYVQLANYTDYGKILIRKDLFSSSDFSELDKAALIVHEAIYEFARKEQEDKNSIRTRKIIGSIFSDISLKDLGRALRLFSDKNSQTNPKPTPTPTPTPTPLPVDDGVQKYFQTNQYYNLYNFTHSFYSGSAPSSLLILNSLENGGWKVQLSGNEGNSLLNEPLLFNIDRQIGDKTWEGVSSYTVTLLTKRKKTCTATSSVQVTYVREEGFSYAIFVIYYPDSNLKYYTDCSFSNVRQITRIPLGK